MRLLPTLTLFLLATAGAAAQEPAPPPAKQFATGLKPTPAHKLLAAPRFKDTANSLVSAPAQFATVPPQLRVWGNDQYGDCVSAEEAAALAAWSVRCTGKEVCATDAEVVSFARKYGYLNGANLDEVMNTMQTHGMVVGGVTYKIGSYSTVNYTNATALQTAIFVGPVNIAIDHAALPSGAGNKQGWYATQGGRYRNTDHCVNLMGYGPAGYLYAQLNVPLPSGLPADTQGYLLFTWGTLGFVTHEWLVSTCTEAWVRNPTTVGMSPVDPPPPPPGPTPVSGGDFTVTTVEVFKDGVRVSTKSTVSANGTPSTATIEAELGAAGVNPLVIADTLKLIADLRAKAGMPTILADVMKLLADLQPANDPAPPPIPKSALPPVGPAARPEQAVAA